MTAEVEQGVLPELGVGILEHGRGDGGGLGFVIFFEDGEGVLGDFNVAGMGGFEDDGAGGGP